MDKRADPITLWTAIAAGVGWALANGLDVISVWIVLQSGGRFVFPTDHTAEYLMIYAGLRMLVALAVYLTVLAVSRHWALVSKVLWSALTAGAFATTIAAWWRLSR
jgi:hypothetical protein